jgi:MFS superfamily sulfate permease-like transporter
MTLADNSFTINGLPLHPLLVHAVVVLLPLAAVGSIIIAVVPKWRRRYWLPVLALAVLGIGAVPITQQAGEALYNSIKGSPPGLAHHRDLGNALLPYAIAFGVMLALLLVVGRIADRERATGGVRAVRASSPTPRQQPVAPGVHSLEDLDEEFAATPGLVEESGQSSSRFWGVITVIVALALIASAVAVGYEIYLIGDSGASAVWKGVGG